MNNPPLPISGKASSPRSRSCGSRHARKTCEKSHLGDFPSGFSEWIGTSITRSICAPLACTRLVVFVPPLVIKNTDDFYKGMDTQLKRSTADCVVAGRDTAQRQCRG